MFDSRDEEVRLLEACAHGDCDAQDRAVCLYGKGLPARVAAWLHWRPVDWDLMEEGVEVLWLVLTETGWRPLAKADLARHDLGFHLTALVAKVVQTLWRKRQAERAHEVPLEGHEAVDADDPAEPLEIYLAEFQASLTPALEEHLRTRYLSPSAGQEPASPCSKSEYKRDERLLDQWRRFIRP